MFVAPSTLRRVAAKHQVSLPEPVARPARPQAVFPQVPWERNRIWIYDASWFAGARRTAYAIVDVVTRYWIGTLLTVEMSSTQIQLLFAHALEDQGLLDPTTGELLDRHGQPRKPNADDGPILVAWSDNGPEMTAADTREFLALLTIAQHHGRPGTPTDQAHIESFWGHVKGEWAHLEQIRDPAVLEIELARAREEYNTVRLHAGIGYVTPADEHHGRAPAIRRARTIGMKRAHQERIKQNRKQNRSGSTP